MRILQTDDFAATVLTVAIAGSCFAIWLGPGSGATCVLALALAAVGARIVWQDLTDFTIPDMANLGLCGLGLASRLVEGMNLGERPEMTLGVAFLDGAICGSVLLTLREGFYRHRGVDGIGLGDVKLAAAGGILIGPTGVAWAILGASLVGLALVSAIRVWPPLIGARTVSDRIAFGAILMPALWGIWIAMRQWPFAFDPV